MRPLKYLLWALLSVALVLLVNANTRSPKPRLSQVDLEFDELAVC